MEYYVALKNMELLSHATTWTDAGHIMQSEINLSQKDLTPLNTAGSSEVTRDACALKGRWVMTCENLLPSLPLHLTISIFPISLFVSMKLQSV